jgi:signal transduction histidine kinase/ligand-binding sensor domain-containing protein/DNA-binding response OmpR family regulator
MTVGTRNILFCFLILASCSGKQQVNEPMVKEQHFFTNSSGKQIITGTPVKIEGKQIQLDSYPQQNFIPVESKKELASFYKKQITPGEPIVTRAIGKKLSSDSLSKKPRSIPVEEISRLASYPEPIPASSPKIKETATLDVRFWGIGENMNSASIWTMIQDRRGDFWLGSTGGGAIRFNGIHFEHFTEKEGLPSNHIFALLEDRKGNIWFGTRDGGVCRYDGAHFTYFNTENGLLHNFVLSIYEDNRGNIWFGTRGGLSRYDGSQFTHYTTEEGLAYDEVISIFEDSQNQLWVGTGEGTGVHRFDGTHFTHYNVGEGKGKNDVHAIIEDKKGNLWFGTWGGGVTRYDGTFFYKYTAEQGLSNDNVLSILEDEKGSIWFGNMGGGVTEYDGRTFTHYTAEEGLSSNSVRFILKDDQHNIWACTWDTGVNRINRKGFKHLSQKDGIEGNTINSIIKGGKGNLWLGTNQGFSKFDGTYFTNFTSNQSIIQNGTITIFKDNQQNLWLGAGGGASQFNGTSIRDYTRAEGLLVGDVQAIHQDQKDHLWFGSYAGGIIRFDGKNYLQFSEKEGYISDDVTAIYEDKKGDLWFGTLGGGVSRFDGTHFVNYTTQEGLSNNYVKSIMEDQQGNMWFGTGDGLDRFDGTSFTRYSTEDGLIHNNIFSFLLDHNANLWITTQKGISFLSADQMSAIQEDKTKSGEVQFISFGKEDGLGDGGVSPSRFTIDKQNRIWFGAPNGIKILDLNQFQLSEKPPQQVRLTNIEVNQAFIDYRRLSDEAYSEDLFSEKELNTSIDSVVSFSNLPFRLRLPYQLNHLSFHFSAIDWTAPGKIQYSYWMEGVDKTWSPAQSEPRVDYRNLPHGKFTLKLKAKGLSNTWSEPVFYSFTIAPPWWQTWWAYLAYSLVLSFIIYQLYQLQLSRRLALEEGKRLKEINNLKSSIYTNITHEFRTPLTVIHGMAEELEDDAPKEILPKTSLIKRNSQKLLAMVNQLLQLSKLEANKEELNLKQEDAIAFIKYLVASHESMAFSKKVSLQFYSDEQQLMMDFDSQKLETILTNLLSNAIKFTNEYGKVLVVARKVNQLNSAYLEMEVKDDGIGIAEEDLPHIFNRFHQVNNDYQYQGTGIGLALVKELVGLMDGKIQVKSQLEEGTTFIIQLPVQNNAPLFSGPPKIQNKGIEPSPEVVIPLIQDQEIAEDGLPVLLIIEDNIDIIHYLQSCLSGQYQLLISRNGAEGLEKAFEKVPDIVISDVMMPKMDGFELCATLKEDSRTNHIPVILLTAKTTVGDKLKGLSSGADAYLTKPFEKKELLIRLDKLLATRQTLQQKYLEELNTGINQPSTTESPSQHFVHKVEQLVLEHLSDDSFSVNELATLVHLSRSQLHRKIKALTGMPASNYIRHIRLLKAKELLQTTDESVSEILYQVGFNSPAYFSQAYKKAFGISPSAERE